MKVIELYTLLRRTPSDANVLLQVNGQNVSLDRVEPTYNGHPAASPVSSLILVPVKQP